MIIQSGRTNLLRQRFHGPQRQRGIERFVRREIDGAAEMAGHILHRPARIENDEVRIVQPFRDPSRSYKLRH